MEEKDLNKIAEEWATSVIKELEAQDKEIAKWRIICAEAGVHVGDIWVKRKKGDKK